MAAVAVLLSPKVAICWLSLAICDIASLALPTASAMPNSAAPRSAWMPSLVALRLCASCCAALMTALRAALSSGLADSACNALVKPL